MSLACGLIPLIVGVLILLAWFTTRADWLMVAGISNIAAGVLLFVCGLVFLGLYNYSERKAGNAYPLKKSFLSLSILLFNFPAATLALYSADYVISTSVLTVENNSPYEVSGFILKERDLVYSFPSVTPNRTVTQKYHFKYEGSVDYRLLINGEQKQGIMFGYVSNGMGWEATMVIDKNGSIIVGQ